MHGNPTARSALRLRHATGWTRSSCEYSDVLTASQFPPSLTSFPAASPTPDSYEVPRNGKSFFLRDREEVHARIELSGLSAGDYEIEAVIPGVASTDHRARFTIRRGDEDVPTARLHYRYKADKVSGDFRAYEATLRDLMSKYEPDNPGIVVMIADWSVDKVPEEETAALYREARTKLEAKWRAEARKGPSRVPDAVQRHKLLEQLTLFERVLPYYSENKKELRFGAAVVGGERVYAWFPRKGGTMIDTIDGADPGRRARTRAAQ